MYAFRKQLFENPKSGMRPECVKCPRKIRKRGDSPFFGGGLGSLYGLVDMGIRCPSGHPNVILLRN